MLEDSDSGQLEDIDVIPNEEMLLVIDLITFYSLSYSVCIGLKFQNFFLIEDNFFIKEIYRSDHSIQKFKLVGEAIDMPPYANTHWA